MREIKVPGPICVSCHNEIKKPADIHYELFRRGIYVHDVTECLDMLAATLGDEVFWGVFGKANS